MQQDADARVARRLAARFAPECWIVLCVRVVAAATHETADAVTSTPDHYLAAAWPPPRSGPAHWPEAVVIGSPTRDARARGAAASSARGGIAVSRRSRRRRCRARCRHPARGRPQSGALPARGHRSVRRQRARTRARSRSLRAIPTAIRASSGFARSCSETAAAEANADVRILGVDFTSAPRRAKPITVAIGAFVDDGLVVERVDRIGDFEGFERLLRMPGPWVGGFDFPFGLPRELVVALGWPLQLAGAGPPLRDARSRHDCDGIRCVPRGAAPPETSTRTGRATPRRARIRR